MIKGKPGMIVTTLSAKFYQGLIDRLEADRAAEFMRAYEQQGPWPDMLRGYDLTYSLLLYPLSRGIHMDLGDFGSHVHAGCVTISQ